MAIRCDFYWMVYYFTLAAFAVCVLPGCASQQDVDRLRSDLRAHIEETEQKSRRLLEFEKLKAAREQKVVALTSIAETLAAARAWNIEAEAYEAHRKANIERHNAIVSQMHSDRARSIGPTEGHEPYAGSFGNTYSSLLPSVKAEVFRLLDRDDYKETMDICYEINKEVQYKAVRETIDKTYPGLSSFESRKKVFEPLDKWDWRDTRLELSGPTADKVTKFKF